MLFDIEADPYEKTDVAEKEPERVADLAERIRVWRSQHPFSGQHVQIVPNPGWRGPKDWPPPCCPPARPSSRPARSSNSRSR